MRRTMVVSVFAGCGKTWLTNHQNQYGYSMRDSDSSKQDQYLSDIIDDLYWKKQHCNLYIV